MSFTIFQNEKTPFQAIKTTNSKSQKIDVFPKGLTHGFSPKNGHFSTFFFFKAIQPRKMSFTIFYKEKPRFQGIKTRSSKRRKIDIFQKRLTHGFEPKRAIFQKLFFQPIQPRKMYFTRFQNEKRPSQEYKKKNLKKSKN